MTTALADLQRACELDRGLARPPVMLIKVAMGLRLGGEAEERFFREAVRRDPRNVGAYTARLTTLMPKWSGEPVEVMWRFVEESLTAQPSEPGLQGLVIEAHWEMARLTDDEHRAKYLTDARVRESFERAHTAVRRAYPRSTAVCMTRQSVANELKDVATSLECHAHRAEAGDSKAQHGLSERLKTGSRGATVDLPSAAEWAWRSAMQEDPGGMTAFARLLSNGRGVHADPAAAHRLMSRAASLSHAPAQYSLGWFYERGIGVPADREKALEWYSRAATSTTPQIARDAQRALERLHASAPR